MSASIFSPDGKNFRQFMTPNVQARWIKRRMGRVAGRGRVGGEGKTDNNLCRTPPSRKHCLATLLSFGLCSSMAAPTTPANFAVVVSFQPAMDTRRMINVATGSEVPGCGFPAGLA